MSSDLHHLLLLQVSSGCCQVCLMCNLCFDEAVQLWTEHSLLFAGKVVVSRESDPKKPHKSSVQATIDLLLALYRALLSDVLGELHHCHVLENLEITACNQICTSNAAQFFLSRSKDLIFHYVSLVLVLQGARGNAHFSSRLNIQSLKAHCFFSYCTNILWHSLITAAIPYLNCFSLLIYRAQSFIKADLHPQGKSANCSI